MMTNPVRTLTFKAHGSLYAFAIDADLQREKAQKISEILDEDGIEPKVDNLPMSAIRLVAIGNVRPMSMRLIIETLAV